MTITTYTVKTYGMNDYERSLWGNFEDLVYDLYNNIEEDEMVCMLRDIMDSMSAFKDNYINQNGSNWLVEGRNEVAEEC